MSLITQVIINEVTNLSDARYCAGMGVDYIGVRIDPYHPKYVNADDFSEISEWVAGVQFLGETSESLNLENIDYKLDGLVIDDHALLTHQSSPALWSIHIDQLHVAMLQFLQSISDNMLGLIITSDNELVLENEKIKINKMAKRFDVFLGYGFDKNNVLDILQELPIKGLALRGSDEIRPGYKDYDQLADILEVLEKEEND